MPFGEPDERGMVQMICPASPICPVPNTRTLGDGAAFVKRATIDPQGNATIHPVSFPTPEELAEWRRLCEAATPGPWGIAPWGDEQDCVVEAGHLRRICRAEHFPCDMNAAFIAAARVALPRLLDEVERLRRLIAAVATDADAVADFAWDDARYWMDRAKTAERDLALAEAFIAEVLNHDERQYGRWTGGMRQRARGLVDAGRRK